MGAVTCTITGVTNANSYPLFCLSDRPSDRSSTHATVRLSVRPSDGLSVARPFDRPTAHLSDCPTGQPNWDTLIINLLPT